MASLTTIRIRPCSSSRSTLDEERQEVLEAAWAGLRMMPADADRTAACLALLNHLARTTGAALRVS